MKIIVCIKQVPDTSEVRIDPLTNNLVRDGVPSIMNPFDRSAIEMAIELRNQAGGSVTVVSMGPRQADKELQLALDLGADKAILICDRAFAGSDTLATAYALSCAIKEEGFDLILCGNEAIDGCTGQVGPGIAENLGIPSFTYVHEIRYADEQLQLCRNNGKRIDTWQLPLPTVACVLRRENRIAPAISGRTPEIRDAQGMNPARIGSSGSPTRVASIATAARSSDYLHVDYRWSLEERMEHIFNGGLTPKQTGFIKGSTEKQAAIIRDLLTGGAGV